MDKLYQNIVLILHLNWYQIQNGKKSATVKFLFENCYYQREICNLRINKNKILPLCYIRYWYRNQNWKIVYNCNNTFCKIEFATYR